MMNSFPFGFAMVTNAHNAHRLGFGRLQPVFTMSRFQYMFYMGIYILHGSTVSIYLVGGLFTLNPLSFPSP